MAAILVQTTSGEVKVDPADIDRLTYWVGDKQRTVEGPHILEMFEAYLAGSELHAVREDHRQRMKIIEQGHDRLHETLRRQMLGE
jgi:hypothetical protein